MNREISARQAGQQIEFFDVFEYKPFWIWDTGKHKLVDIKTNGQCCFNHIIGLPRKQGKEKPLFDYEKLIFNALQSNKHLWIKKATGLGITEFMLRYMTWLCFKDANLKGSQMCIVTGPRIDLAITLIDRMKKLFYRFEKNVTFDSKETIIELNGVRVEAFPSHHLDAMRGIANVSFILLDEADFFPVGQQQDARNVSERYIAKSNPYIVMVSTPNAPDGLFENIENESESECLYKRFHLDYFHGIGKIYTVEEIEVAKTSPSFEREYNLKYLGNIGNMFPTVFIESAQALAEMFPGYRIDPVQPGMVHYIGVDPGWSTSKFAITVVRYNPAARYPTAKAPPNYYERLKVLPNSEYNLAFNYDLIETVYFQQLKQPNVVDTVNLCFDLYRKYGRNNVYFFVDASAIPFIQSLKMQLNENPNYMQIDTKYWQPSSGFRVTPIQYTRENRRYMIANTYDILSMRALSIPKDREFRPLIVGLSAATGKEFDLDKDESPENDALDSLNQALFFFKRRQRKKIMI